MRKSLRSLGIAAIAASMPAMAVAELPNATFDTWVDCIPWTSTDNKAAQGTTPENWCISNVIGIPMGFLGNMGATTVGEKIELTDGINAVKVFNAANPMMATQIVPGYFSLGTTWSTSNGMKTMTGDTSTNDGGSFGGITCETRPDGIAFSYQRSLGSEESAQTATVVAYLWKGTFKQADVPGNIYLSEDQMKTVTMVDRDRNILGIQTNLGGEVTKTDDAALIAKINRPIAAVADEWTELTLPFEYESDAAPEKLNIIFAANDYFSADNIENGNSLSIVNPRLVYFSRLSGITISGKSLENFESGVYTYYVETLPAENDVKFETLGQAAKAEITSEAGKIIITVTNGEGTDSDGRDTHTYILTDEPLASEATEYTGKLTINMAGEDLTPEGGQSASILITPLAEGTCTFVLPNFALDMGNGPMSLGDITVTGVTMTQEGTNINYAGNVKDMELAGGQIKADVSLTGVTTADGSAAMTINVVWNGLPITCTFNGDKTAGIDTVISDQDGPVEYFDLRGVRVNPDNLPAGIYLRRQGSKVEKLLIK